MDTSKRPHNDGGTTQESRFQGSVLSGRAFTVVLVTDNHPRDTSVSVGGTDGRDSAERAIHLVQNLVGLATVGVNGTNQAVLRNVLQVPSVLQPGSTGGDMVGGALALGLDQDGSLSDVLAVPWLERSQKLESVRLGVNGNLDAASVLGGSLEGVLSRVVTSGGKLVTSGVGELKLLAVGTLQGVGQGVEGQATGKGHGGDKVRRGNKGVGGRVGVVST